MGRTLFRVLLVLCPALVLTGCAVHRNPTLDFRLAVRGASVVDQGAERALTMSADTVLDEDLTVVVWGAPAGFILSFHSSSDDPATILWDEANLVGPGGSPHPLVVSDEARIFTHSTTRTHGMRLIGRIYEQPVRSDEPTVALFRAADPGAMGSLYRIENESCQDLLTGSYVLTIPLAWGEGRREYHISMQPEWLYFDASGAIPELRCGPVPADIS